MQKHVNLVDLVKSFPTNIFLQNLASIQKRTSSVKFDHLAEKSDKGSISNLSTKVRRPLGDAGVQRLCLRHALRARPGMVCSQYRKRKLHPHSRAFRTTLVDTWAIRTLRFSKLIMLCIGTKKGGFESFPHDVIDDSLDSKGSISVNEDDGV